MNKKLKKVPSWPEKSTQLVNKLSGYCWASLLKAGGIQFNNPEELLRKPAEVQGESE